MSSGVHGPVRGPGLGDGRDRPRDGIGHRACTGALTLGQRVRRGRAAGVAWVAWVALAASVVRAGSPGPAAEPA